MGHSGCRTPLRYVRPTCYRNHGADYGRVLVGMQVPPDEEPMLQRFLDEIGYRYWDETDNPANVLFLSGTGQ
ncbi:MAG: hypothetical protein U5K34_07630 [Thiohalophilus sp.]|nr:hypothetical protein [Thiohalophilus sp.]MDZ7803839.1 hypothetical protein [Thiohalophilus sp.]